jgi:dynein heavy chain
VYIHGLTLEGARWDAKNGCLRDSLPNQLRQALPVLLVRPVTAEVYAEALAAGDLYLCPLYTNGQRANVSAVHELLADMPHPSCEDVGDEPRAGCRVN